jgi:hypothetical protein
MPAKSLTSRLRPKAGKRVPLGVSELRARLAELEETLRAIRSGEVDALVVSEGSRERIYTLQGADHVYRIMVEAISEGAATLPTRSDPLRQSSFRRDASHAFGEGHWF